MRRSTILTTTLLFGMTAWLTGLSSCATLEPFDEGCGNSLVEQGEDCDTFSQFDGSTCAAPGQPNQCRYTCTLEDDVCPPGWVCGTDKICRRHSGEFTDGAKLSQSGVSVRTVDIDGRFPRELVVATTQSMRVLTFDAVGQSTEQSLAKEAGFLPLFQDITDDGLDDFLIPLIDGLAVLRGAPDGKLRAKAYSPFPLPESESIAYTSLGAGITALGYGESQMFYLDASGDDDPRGSLRYLDKALDFGELVSTPVAPSTLAGPIASAQLHPGLCEELAYGAIGGESIFLVDACVPKVDEGGMAWGGDQVSLTLSGEARLLAGPFIVDANFDDRLDVVAIADRCTCGFAGIEAGPAGKPPYCLVAAFGALDQEGETDYYGDPTDPATLHELACVSPLMEPGEPGSLAAIVAVDAPPLAVGHIDNDARLDFVTEAGIFLSAPEFEPPEPGTGSGGSSSGGAGGFGGAGGSGGGGGSGVGGGPPDLPTSADGPEVWIRAVQNLGAPWSRAEIVDLQGNGFVDVVATSDEASGVDFFNGAPQGLNLFHIDTDGAVQDLSIGDYDGDLLLDVSIQQFAGGGASELSILYGKSAGGPEAPRLVGEIESIQQLHSARVDSFNFDGITDLAVVSGESPSWSLAVFRGRSDRLIQSPFEFARKDENEEVERWLAATVGAGNFMDGGGPGIAAAAFRISGPDLEVLATDTILFLPRSGDADLDIGQMAVVDYRPVGDGDADLVFRVPQFILPVDTKEPGRQSALVLTQEIRGNEDQANATILVDRAFAPSGGDPGGFVELVSVGGALLGPYLEGTALSGEVEDEPLDAVQRADLDGDGVEDLVFLFHGCLGSDALLSVCFEDPDLIRTSLAAAYRDVDDEGGFRFGELPEMEGRIVAFTTIQLDTDPARELVVATLDDENELYLWRFDHDGDDLVPFEIDGEIEPLVEDLPPIRSLAGGDFNGDGLDDLALLGEGGLTLLIGRAK